jgi:serine/threonine protein kinase
VFNDATMMKTCCGSPEYVAPEILLCMSYDAAVDMWSIGIIVYILLTGCFPFWSENVQTLYQKIMNGAYRWPTKPEVSDSAKDLVRRLLEKNPKKRMTADECLKHPWITGQTVTTQQSARDWAPVQESRKSRPKLPPITPGI